MFAGNRVGWFWAALTAMLAFFPAPLWAEDAFYRVPLRDLKLTAGKYPPLERASGGSLQRPYAVLDGPGEALVDFRPGTWPAASP